MRRKLSFLTLHSFPGVRDTFTDFEHPGLIKPTAGLTRNFSGEVVLIL